MAEELERATELLEEDRGRLRHKNEVEDQATDIAHMLQMGDQVGLSAVVSDLEARGRKMQEDTGTWQASNGMTILHHACRQLQFDAAAVFLRWAPGAANKVTYTSGKPNHWTSLQCLCDNDGAVVKLVELRENADVDGSASGHGDPYSSSASGRGPPGESPLKPVQLRQFLPMLVDAMAFPSVANATGRVERSTRSQLVKESGGLTALHALGSRGNRELLIMLCQCIERRWDTEHVVSLLNETTADGKGVIDITLGANTKLAVELKRLYPGVEEQRPRPEKNCGNRRPQAGWDDQQCGHWNWDKWEGQEYYGDEWWPERTERTRRQWHTGDSHYKRRR